MTTTEAIDRLLPSAQAINAILSRKLDVLPGVSVVIMRLLQLTRDEDASFNDLVKLVETDPGLSATVLRRVNSAAYGYRRKIASIMEAVVILGFNTIRGMAMEIMLYEQLIKRRYRSSQYIAFWRHSLVVAYSCRTLAQQIGYENEDAAYCAGLLHDIGKIILDSCGKLSYSDIMEQLKQSALNPIEEESRLIGLGHDAVGGYFCRQWGFPDNITLAVAYHHRRFDALDIPAADKRLTAIVALANFIAVTQGLTMEEKPKQALLAPEATEWIDIGKVDFAKLLAEADKNLKETSEFYQFQFPDAPTIRQNLLLANLSLGCLNSRLHYQPGADPAGASAGPGKNLSLPHQSLIPDEIKQSTLTAIQHDFNFDRLYIFDLERESRSLFLSYMLDDPAGMHPSVGTHLEDCPRIEKVLNCLRQKIPVIITGETTHEVEFLNKFEAPAIGLVPITQNGHISGIIGVDNCASKRAISPETLDAIAVIAAEMGVALEHARLFEQFKQRALLDGLTRIYNRGAIEEYLANAFEHDRANLAVGMVDIDYFKKFNDTFGHSVGDDVLKIVASLIKKYSRPQDQVGRYGGEEFIFVLHSADFEQALLFAERLRAKTEKLGVILENRFKKHFLTLSVGVAVYEPDIENYPQLIQRADQALYEAKHQGRNRIMGFQAGKLIGLKR
jgi:diguanylate cyclase (GGDEF)-like protein/putative nucleotidyltransferase with HDIG domain